MIKADFKPYNFKFNFLGGTSRGVLSEKPSFFVKIWDDKSPEVFGLGEISLIPGLSPEKPNEVEKLLNKFILNPEKFYDTTDLTNHPAVKFGIETAFTDLKNGGKRILYPSEFTTGAKGIQINGLIWMGDKDIMLQRLKEKVNQGFSCLKLKIGAIDFDEELNLLKFIRQSFSAREIELRVDANGAFGIKEAANKLELLSKFGIHSIEQPIKEGQWNEMAKLCNSTPIPIALDEELIGITNTQEQENLLDTIKPQYIILKPSLVGGLNEMKKWSGLATDRNIAWWITSALEGNIGLNAIAQWTYLFGSKMPQGLGTGQVFSNNIESPLEIKGEQLWVNPEKEWDLNNMGWGNVNRFSPNQSSVVPLENNSSNQSNAVSLEDNSSNQYNAVPLEGVGGWNISSNSNDNISNELENIINSQIDNLVQGDDSTPVLRTPPKGGDETRKPQSKLHGEIENIKYNSLNQSNAVPLENKSSNQSNVVPLEGVGGWKTILASKENNYHYNKKLKDRATYLRNHATKAEACIWKFVLKSQPLGFQFTRQRPILNYIADFMCKELMLIIEVDGATHFIDDIPNNDKRRQSDLESVGFTVLRFEDEGVLYNITGIQTLLEQYINEFLELKNSTPVLRTPPQGGDGALKPQSKLHGEIENLKNSSSNQSSAVHLENKSSNQSSAVPLENKSSNQSNAVPLEGVGGWNISSNSNDNISKELENKFNSQMDNLVPGDDSTPVLRTPPQGGDGTRKSQSKLHGEIENLKNNSSNLSSTFPLENNSSNKSNAVPLENNSLTHSNAVPLEGAGGWNITLNGIAYNLQNANWDNLKTLHQNEQWWIEIVDFLEEWSNNSQTLTLKTSGSTGKPKIMEVEKIKLWISATKTCEFFQLNEASTGLLCLSANYIAGKMMLVRAMVSGMNLICVEPSNNPVKDITIPIDFAAMVPMQVEQSLLLPEKFNLLKDLIIGGGQVSSKLASKLQEHDVNAYETFGMTETLSHIALKQLAPNKQKHFTPFNGVFILQGYNNALVIDFPELGIYKLKTNDIIEMVDTSGAFIWKGRTDFIINSGGIKISPEEIEAKIAHLFLQPFCISGIADEKLGEKVVLCLEGSKFDTTQLMIELKKILLSYSCPKEIRFLNKFPVTDSGKIKRKDIFN